MKQEKKFQIFRAHDMAQLGEADIMTMVPPTKGIEEMMACVDAGLPDGTTSQVIFAGFGLSLVRVWFKKNFPLPLHSHDADCVYYIIAGGLRLGTEDLGAGDGFFIPAGVPYTYTPGAQGVELIEVRNSARFDYRERSTAAFWKKALKTVQDNHGDWIGSPEPGTVAETTS
ncbi:cupin domain-containing protein [Sphingomonas solaris]|uniref:Cupin domain-containing protein n=1 Tax=Alterirhizorhabdus solaris TaxID=2529389 RepID=A0A558R510_9SPHN|nr:cupin domain-containing protein [Sphingomonas solaris]TVV74475.1 cupin domain-containing protein [Sphingomonas solaris]